MTTPNRAANAAMTRLANPAITKAPEWETRTVEPASAAQAADGAWGSLRVDLVKTASGSQLPVAAPPACRHSKAPAAAPVAETRVATPCSIAATGCAASTSGFELERLEACRVVAAGLPRAIIRHGADRVGTATVETYGKLLRYVSCTGPIRVMYGKLRV